MEFNQKEDRAVAITDDFKLIIFDLKKKTQIILEDQHQYFQAKWIDASDSIIAFSEQKVAKIIFKIRIYFN